MSAPPELPAPRMGYQPSLDGLRALSVVAVLLYHGGFSWMHGGFFGVEVFFVVSGFLITSLLLEERERTGRVSFAGFWMRRARRLLPALFAVLFAVLLWVALLGTPEQVAQVRRDVPWAVLYVGNWGQILGDVPYFAGEPPLLRHVWSLAVEEQWYLIWPLAFVGLMALRMAPARRAALVVGVAVASMVFTWWLASGAPTPLGGPPALFDGVDRTNFMYLSTFTRAGGLLLGAAAAFVWRPWRWRGAPAAPIGRLLDPLGAAILALLGCISATAVLTETYVYQWLLPAVSLLSLAAVMIAVHPAATGYRRLASWDPLVAVGKRSYGLYLWSWPIFVVLGATEGSVWRFVAAMAVTVLVAELSYRHLETPVRQGAISRWWQDRRPVALAPALGLSVLVVSLGAFYVSADRFDRFEGGESTAFDLTAATGGEQPVLADGATAAMAGEGAAEGAPEAGGAVAGVDGSSDPGAAPAGSTVPPTTVPAAPTTADLAVVGDSQANALVINLPTGIEAVFPSVTNGSLDGCSVWDSGGVRSAVAFRNSFSICEGWQEQWAEAASGNDVALVVIGAWDVFDVVDGDTVYGFDTPAGDQRFAANLRSGVDAMLAEGADVALLEVPCMRPVDVDGAGVRALPERGDDDRVAHLNETIRWVASQYGPRVQFVEGPDEWCTDPSIATDLGYRWDGVHVYRPGANLIMEAVTDDLLRMAGS